MRDEYFDPSKEGRRVVTKYGQPNQNQITEDRQRQEEAASRRDEGAAVRPRA